MKKLFILFPIVLLMISLGGCRMSIDRKSIAEKALQEQYGEEFVAYHTWDHGGDSFDVSLYPKSDESIKFNAVVSNKGSIVVDYYAEKIVGKEIIEIIKPYIDEIAGESTYFATVQLGENDYTNKNQVNIDNFYKKAKKNEFTWPYIYIAINVESINSTLTYESEYEILLQACNNDKMNITGGVGLILYFVRKDAFKEYEKLFDSLAFFDSQLENPTDVDKKVFFLYGDGNINQTLNQYIEKRKEFSYE